MEKQYTLNLIKNLILIISLGIINTNLLAQKDECHADFEFENENQTLIFLNTSNVITNEILWDFGDGNYSTEPDPVHTYAENGIYLVCLIISNDTCFDEKCKAIETDEINNDECLAFYEYGTTENEFEINYFNLSIGNIDSVLWEFGDGNISKALSPNHIFLAEGNYLTCLTIFTPQCVDFYCTEIIIKASTDCDAFFEYETTDNNFEIAYNNLSLGDIDSVLWKFGDGSTSKLTNPNHTFTAEGEYLTSLDIFAKQCADIYYHVVTVENTINCEANFSFDIEDERPNIIHFTDESIGNSIIREWDFTDIEEGGSFSTEENPSHVFPQNGSYNVKLKIIDNNCSDEIIIPVEINVPLTVDFTFLLDSNNLVPNTFIFNPGVDGFHDELYWNFDNQTTPNRDAVTHIYTEQNKEYDVCLTAEYHFNDTSSIKEVLCKTLTTSEYFDIGGQVFFGDSLLNNPNPTGDSAIAYLYRIDDGKTMFIDTNYYTRLGYYWFAQQLKASYIIKTELLENSTHLENYAPTYVGNTSFWEEAEIIDLKQNEYRKDIHLIKKSTSRKGEANIQGTIDDFMSYNESQNNAIIYVYDLENQLISFQYTKEDDYNFMNLIPGHYVLKTDLTGIHTNPKLRYIGLDNKSKNAINQAQLFPNPATNYSILHYENPNNNHQIQLNIYTLEGYLVSQQELSTSTGTNYLKINLVNLPSGMLFLHIIDGSNSSPIKLLHK